MKFCFVCSNSSCINQGCLYLPCQVGYSHDGWTPLIIHEKMVDNPNAQSLAHSKSNQNNCKQNSPRIVVSWTVPVFWTIHGVCLLVVREYKLYLSVWELPIMYVAWKIPRSLGCYVDNESMPLEILFISISKRSFGTSTNPCFPLRRAYLFTFIAESSFFYKKHQ